MTATPDGISMEKLLAFQKTAVNEEPEVQQLINGQPVSKFISSVDELQDALHKKHSHPMTAKKLIMDNLAVLIGWHTDRGISEFNEGNDCCGVAWLRDAGKCQAAMQLILSVILPDDFISGTDTETDNN